MATNKDLLQLKFKKFDKIVTLLELEKDKGKELLDTIIWLAVSHLAQKNPLLNKDVQKVANTELSTDVIETLTNKLDDTNKNDFILEVMNILDEYVQEVSKSLSGQKKEEIAQLWRSN